MTKSLDMTVGAFIVRVGLLLFVCEGNLCRSPLSERVLGRMLAQTSSSGVVIRSAGTSPALGRAIPKETAEIIKLLGTTSDGHSPRKLQQQCLAGAGLVLTATRDQRAAVIRLHPAAVRYTFTIRQLGYILEALGFDGPLSVRKDPVGAIAEEARRGRALAAGLGDNADVVDPFGRPYPVHALAAIQMLPTLNLLSTALGGTPIEAPSRLIEAAHKPRWWKTPWKRRR